MLSCGRLTTALAASLELLSTRFPISVETEAGVTGFTASKAGFKAPCFRLLSVSWQLRRAGTTPQVAEQSFLLAGRKHSDLVPLRASNWELRWSPLPPLCFHCQS